MNGLLKLAVALAVLAAVVVALAWWDRQVEPEGAGTVAAGRVDAQSLRERGLRHSAADEATGQVLYGDLHVHTTFSMDAFVWALPLMHGPGARPPADACDYARFCSALDFYAHTDHSESLTPRHWSMMWNSGFQSNIASMKPGSVLATNILPEAIMLAR